jgi:FkbH-like protein
MKEIPSLNELKRNLKRPSEGLPTIRLAVAADSASQLAVQALGGYARELKLRLEIYEADYDQIDLQLLDPSSELYGFRPEFILIWQSAEKLSARFAKLGTADRTRFADDHLAHLGQLVDAVARHASAKVIVCNFLDVTDGVFGSFAAKLESSWLYQIRKLNLRLMDFAREHRDVSVLDLAGIALEHGVGFVRDDRLAITASTIIGIEALPLFAKHVLDIVAAATGRFKKCLILDLDNTLWGGVIGDDGIDGIEIGDLGIGMAFSQLQRWAKQLKQRGVILAVSSKNDAAIARGPFEKHPDMLLRLEDFAVFQANWDNKVDNIRHIQSILEIGFDSMVFLDDNPVERLMVKQALPDLCVPDLPEDPVGWLTYLRRLNLFETSSFTAEDGARTVQYQEEAKRREVQHSYANEAEFLASLAMQGKAEGFSPYNIPRVAQLILRSNQFNLRTVRHSEEDVRRMAVASDVVPLAFSLGDQFGDYGLISVVVMKRVEHALFVDTWIMSCRVLKRGMEDFVLNELVEVARAEKRAWLIGEYLPTAKNGLVKEHYPRLGFEPFDGRWRLDVNAYVPRPTHIRKALP